MAHVIEGSKIRRVKNLAWLLSHWKNVASFSIIVKNPMSINDLDTDLGGAILIAYNWDNEPIYICTWASHQVMFGWLNRPHFRDLPVMVWYKYRTFWNKAEWRDQCWFYLG